MSICFTNMECILSNKNMLLLALILALHGCTNHVNAAHDSDKELREENDVIQYTQYCYSCSSKSVMCDESVYDGQYLTTLPCKSSCFLKKENNVTYRGCFDGWMGGLIRNNYMGCQRQIYFGKAVEWCFCSASDPGQAEPCNGQSRDIIAQNKVKFDSMSPYMNSNGRNSDNIVYTDGVARRGYDSFPGDYPYINREADKYRDATGELHSCKDRKDGTFSDPSDCSRYYLCTNGYSYRMRCSRGTQWNQRLHACAFAFHAMSPCKQQGDIFDGKSYRYPAKQTPSNFIKPSQKKPTEKKKPKRMEEFYHYY